MGYPLQPHSSYYGATQDQESIQPRYEQQLAFQCDSVYVGLLLHHCSQHCHDQIRAIWGTTVNIAETIKLFREFYVDLSPSIGHNMTENKIFTPSSFPLRRSRSGVLRDIHLNSAPDRSGEPQSRHDKPPRTPALHEVVCAGVQTQYKVCITSFE